MVVEIPKGDKAKMEINKKEPLNPIKQDIKVYKYIYIDTNSHPHPYPYLHRTSMLIVVIGMLSILYIYIEWKTSLCFHSLSFQLWSLPSNMGESSCS